MFRNRLTRAASALLLALAACASTPARAERTAPLLPHDDSCLARVDEADDDSASLGRPNGGALAGAVAMPAGEAWELMVPVHAFATGETVRALSAAIGEVHATFPGSHALAIGEMSAEFGGPLYPHLSHQAGRDVDLGYYYLPVVKGIWYVPANKLTLDVPRSWALVKALLATGDVEYLFIDRRVQALLQAHAIASGEDRAWLAGVFQSPSRKDTVVRHASGHATHLHVRFFNPRAQARGRALYETMTARELIGKRGYTTEHHAAAGDDLAGLALRYAVPSQAIVYANRLGEEDLIPGHVYRIPRRGRILPPQPQDLEAPCSLVASR
jgi:murein endopeptidase